MYAPQGWEQVKTTTSSYGVEKDDFRVVSKNNEINQQDLKEKNSTENSISFDDDSEYEEDEVDFSEIPLSEMSVPQLKQYGKQLGIEVDTDSAKALRNRIRKVLEK